LAASPLDQSPLLAGPQPWRKLDFLHGYYTALTRPAPPNSTGNYIRETIAPVPLTIGFYKLEDGGRDRAYLESLAGADAFGAGDYAAADRRFRAAAAADPACLRCKYILAISRAGLGDRAGALRELSAIEKVSPGAVPAEYRELIEELAAGRTETAADLAFRVGNRNPELFFRKNFQGGIRAMGNKSGKSGGGRAAGSGP